MNTTSWACFLRSGLQYILHWLAHLEILSKSLFCSFVKILWKLKKQMLSSAKVLREDEMFLVKSLMYIKKSKDPKIDPCGIPGSAFPHENVSPSRATLWNLFSKN